MGDIYINYTEKDKTLRDKQENEEDQTVTVRPRAGAPVSGEPQKARRVFKSPREKCEYESVRRWLDVSEEVRDVFGDSYTLAERLLEDERYPVELVGRALEMTYRRDGRCGQGLRYPVSYAQSLLEDWKSRGITSLEELREANEDYYGDYFSD